MGTPQRLVFVLGAGLGNVIWEGGVESYEKKLVVHRVGDLDLEGQFLSPVS
jgi:hypothetical protein